MKIFLQILLIAEIFAAFPAIAFAGDFQCDEKIISSVPSSDDFYDAVVSERVCSTSGFGSTVVTNAVSIVGHGKDYKSGKVVYEIEVGGGLRVYVGWVSIRRLWMYTPDDKPKPLSALGPWDIVMELKKIPKIPLD